MGRLNAAMFELMRGNHARATANARELARLAHEHELVMIRAFNVFLEGWASATSGPSSDGLANMRRGVELLCEQNVLMFDGLLKIALAEAEAAAGDPERALAILEDALSTVDRTGYRAFEADLLRARGEILLKRDPDDPAPAEDAYRTAIAVAKQQGARSLRAARVSFARQTLSVDRPPRRSPRGLRARARRLFADAGNAGDRRGAGAARGAVAKLTRSKRKPRSGSD